MIRLKEVNNRGFAHAFILLLFVVVFGIAGAYYLVASHADTVSFTLLGTHPQATAQPTSVGKTITTLKGFNGKIYAGYGDYGANTGPIAITPFDLTTNTFAATPELSDATESINAYRTWGGKLYVPSTDPGGSYNSIFSIGTLTGSTVDWRQFSSLAQPPLQTPYMEHVFDVNTLTGTDIWLVGGAGNDAVTYRSTDDGLTWKEMYRVTGSSAKYYRFYAGGLYNGKFYVQAMAVDQTTNSIVAPEANSHVFNGTSWSNGPSLINQYNWWHAESFAGKMVYLGWSNADGVMATGLRIFNGSSVTTLTSPAQFNDYSIDGTTLYALGNGNVYSTTDLTNWFIQAAAPANATSVTAYNGKIYVGTGDSKIFSAPVNPNPTATSGGTTTSCKGKGCNTGGGGSVPTCHGKRC